MGVDVTLTRLLRRKATVAEWESEFMLDGIPFGFCHREWESLKCMMQPGDEVWFFSSDAGDWERMMGWEGMALVRGDEVVDFFLTALN
jgi:hypothetical protein